MNLPEIYVSTDIETDGPYPVSYSMLSLASAAFFSDGTLLNTFSVNLEILPEATQHPETMVWWKSQPKAWEACRRDQQSPAVAMKQFCDWVRALPGRPIFVAYPLVFDYPFVSYYLNRFAEENPFGFAGIDIRSYVMGLRGKDYKHSGIHYLPKKFTAEIKNTHVALDDALEQGRLFCRLVTER